MKIYDNKEDQLVSMMIKDLEMENPSEGFADRVMQGIQTQARLHTLQSSPLISKTGWIGIAIGVSVLFVVIFLGGESQELSEETGWLAEKLSSISLPAINFSFYELFSRINTFSSTLLWIIISIGGLILLAFLQRLIETLSVRREYS